MSNTRGYLYCIYLFLLITCLCSKSSTAQKSGQVLVDSLAGVVTAMAADTNKVKLLDRISFMYSTINPEEGLGYGEKALALAEKLHWTKGIASANVSMGVNYASQSEYDKAIKYYQRAMDFYLEADHENSAAAVMANTSLIYLNQSNYPMALKYAFDALSIKEKYRDTALIAVITENIGSIYLEQKNYSKTMEYYTAALETYRELGNHRAMARSQGNIGIVLDAKGEYEKALEHHLQALATNKKHGNKHNVQVNYANVGYVYGHLNDHAKALEYKMKALELSKELKSKKDIAINMGNIGETYFAIATATASARQAGAHIKLTKAANLREAIKHLEEAIAICNEIGFSAPVVEFSQYLSDAYYRAGNHRKAYETFKYAATIKDSVFSIQSKAQLAQLETKRAHELRDKDLLLKDKQIEINKLELQTKRNERILFIVGIAFLLLLLALILKALYTYKKSNRALSIEKAKNLAMIAAQVNQIRKQAGVLQELAHRQSHDVRGLVATILGLSQLFNTDDFSDPTNKVVVDGIASITRKLDTEIQEMIRKENSLGRDNVDQAS